MQSLLQRLVNDELTGISVRTVDKKVIHNFMSLRAEAEGSLCSETGRSIFVTGIRYGRFGLVLLATTS